MRKVAVIEAAVVKVLQVFIATVSFMITVTALITKLLTVPTAVIQKMHKNILC